MFRCAQHNILGEYLGKSMVRIEGLEPTCLAALDPKSSASANFAISAQEIQKTLNFRREFRTLSFEEMINKTTSHF